MHPHPRRWTLSRTEVVLLAVLSLTTVGLMLRMVVIRRETEERYECMNNLRQLGIACTLYHDVWNAFPTEAGDQRSFYVSLMPMIQCGWEIEPDPAARPVPTKLFLCPARRTPRQAPGKRDYGYAGSPGEAILDSPDGVNMLLYTNRSGPACTLLLSHLWMDPAHYAGGDPTDQGWMTKNNHRPISSTATADGDRSGSTWHMGGPHPKAMPSLFVDGQVVNIPYTWGYWANAWNPRNTQPFPLP